MTERIARPERRPHWGGGASRIGAGEPLDERSMRALEVLIAGLVLGVVGLLSLVQPVDGQSGMVNALALGCVLFVVALLSLVR